MNQGQTERFRELYEMTYSRAEYTAKKYLTNEQDVQDVLQDSYVKAFTKLDTLQDPSKKQSWINMIVANTAMDLLKRKRPYVFSDLVSEDEDDGPLEFEDESTEFQVEANVDRRELARLVDEVLEQLDQKYRLVLFQRYGQELKISEIAELNGCSENTVKTRLSRAEKQLKAKKDEFWKRGIEITTIPVVLLLKMAFFPETSYAAPNEAVFQNSLAEARKVMESQTAGTAGGKAVSAAQNAGAAAVAAKTAGTGAAVKIIAAVLAVGVIAGGAVIAGRKEPEKLETGIETMTSEAIDQDVPAETMPLEPETETVVETGTEPESGPVLFSEDERALLSDLFDLMGAEPETIAEAYNANREKLVKLYEKAGTFAWMGQTDDNTATGKGLLLDSDHGMYLGDLKHGQRDGTGTLVWQESYDRFAVGTWSQGVLNGHATLGNKTDYGWCYAEGTAVGGNLTGEITHKRCASVWDGYETFVFNASGGVIQMDDHWEYDDKKGKYVTYSLEHPKLEKKVNHASVRSFSIESPEKFTVLRVNY